MKNEIIDSKKVAIETRLFGTRIVCRISNKITGVNSSQARVSIPYDHSLNNDDNYNQAVKELCQKMNWSGRLAKGVTKKGYVFVFID